MPGCWRTIAMPRWSSIAPIGSTGCMVVLARFALVGLLQFLTHADAIDHLELVVAERRIDLADGGEPRGVDADMVRRLDDCPAVDRVEMTDRVLRLQPFDPKIGMHDRLRRAAAVAEVFVGRPRAADSRRPPRAERRGGQGSAIAAGRLHEFGHIAGPRVAIARMTGEGGRRQTRLLRQKRRFRRAGSELGASGHRRSAASRVSRNWPMLLRRLTAGQAEQGGGQ